MMYKVCSECGANLDHGERCDCQNEKIDNTEIKITKNVGNKQIEKDISYAV